MQSSSGYKSIKVGLVKHFTCFFTFFAVNNLTKLNELTKTDSKYLNVLSYYISSSNNPKCKPNLLHQLLYNQWEYHKHYH